MKNWLLIIFIIVFIIIIAAYALTITLLLTCNVCKNDIIIGAIGSGLTFIGTTALGIVTVWQGRKANRISELVFQNKVNCDLVPNKDIQISRDNLDIQQVITFAKRHETEGLFCEISNETYDKVENTFLIIALSFASSGDMLEECKIKNIYLNKTFVSDPNFKQYYVPFKILNPQERLVLRYNPQDKQYHMEICMRYKKKLSLVNTAGYFVMDLEVELKSSYQTTRIVRYSLNFGSIAQLNNVITFGGTTLHQLDNVVIHRS